MRYTVIWVPDALDALARLWMQASDQQAVADASNRIDRVLADDPDRKGRPSRKFFILDELPLSVLYYVAVDDRMVYVIAVKRI